MENRQHYSDLLRTAFILEGRLVYKKLKKCYRIFCMKCQRYEYVSSSLFKQIQASQICPMCFQEIKPSRMLEHMMLYHILDDDDDGYRVFVDFIFGRKPRMEYEHVFRYQNCVAESRLIQCNMGYSFGYRPDLTEWKVRRNAEAYYYRFHTTQSIKALSGKREYIYTALFDRGITNPEADQLAKSNQKKIFQDNLLNGIQMEYVIAFDLKNYEQVYKYRSYMRKNTPAVKIVLNVHYLDYLYRNKIRLRDFYDYMNQCQILGFKLDKPKDFEYRHRVLSDMVARFKNEQNEKMAKQRYAELLQKAYSKGNIKIMPFKDGNEIRRCGKQLHNCIATYISSYAEKRTDLFYLADKGKKKAAIEVCDNRLVQARSDKNKECSAEMMKHIRRWCKQNRFLIERYT